MAPFWQTEIKTKEITTILVENLRCGQLLVYIKPELVGQELAMPKIWHANILTINQSHLYVPLSNLEIPCQVLEIFFDNYFKRLLYANFNFVVPLVY